MQRLVIELGRYRTLVFGRILEQDESLRHKDLCIGVPGGDFTIRSQVYPYLDSKYLWVRGSCRDADTNVFLHICDSEANAETLVARIQGAVRYVNQSSAPAPSGQVALLRVE